MGGTSTDVSHFDGEYERAFETRVAGVRMRAPMMQIHTVAAGGGSILFFEGGRYRVGPDSAGANPGPACYRRGGPLTVTDCNVMLGRIQADFFPRVFGAAADQPIDAEVVRKKFAALAKEIQDATGDSRSPEQVAEGFLRIAVANMANAIKEISIQRGYDVTDYTLCCFGGAGAQHACAVADQLGMVRVFLHPLAGVLSAYGMGLADMRVLRERAVEARLSDDGIDALTKSLDELEADGRAEMERQSIDRSHTQVIRRVHLRYEGTDSPLVVAFGSRQDIVAGFETAHRQRYGFIVPEKSHIVEAVSVEVIGKTENVEDPELVAEPRQQPLRPKATVPMWVSQGGRGAQRDTPLYDRGDLLPGDVIRGPAIIIEPISTIVIEPGWRASFTARGHLVLERVEAAERGVAVGTAVDPVMLEIFNNLFMSIAEQMGSTLENTSHSVNIKERLDFSCAVFDHDGQLIANAPHMPVHLGSMGESVQTMIRQRAGAINARRRVRAQCALQWRHPSAGYHGHHAGVRGSRPPAAFSSGSPRRGHHADIGGITPGLHAAGQPGPWRKRAC